jgi:hypothetical protein
MSEFTPNTPTGTFKVGQRVLMKTRAGVREAIIRDFGSDMDGGDVVWVDFPSQRNAPVGSFLGLCFDARAIIGPVVTRVT